MNQNAIDAIIKTRLSFTSIRDFCKQYKIGIIELQKIVNLRENITQSLHSLSPDFTDPDNLEDKTLPELIELLIAAGNYWKEQAEN